jgi:hypothetical protein
MFVKKLKKPKISTKKAINLIVQRLKKPKKKIGKRKKINMAIPITGF